MKCLNNYAFKHKPQESLGITNGGFIGSCKPMGTEVNLDKTPAPNFLVDLRSPVLRWWLTQPELFGLLKEKKNLPRPKPGCRPVQQHVQDKVLLAFETVNVVQGCNHSNQVEILHEFWFRGQSGVSWWMYHQSFIFFIVVLKFAVPQSGLDIWENQSQRKIYLKCLRIINCQFHLLMYVFRGFNSLKAHICLVVSADIVFFFFLKIDKQANKARMEHEKNKKKGPLH